MLVQHASIGALLCVGVATAQATATVAVVQSIKLQTSGSPPTTLNVGPLPPTSTRLSAGFNTTLSQVWIDPIAINPWLGAAGWQVLADLRTATAGPQPGTASVSGRIEIVFTAPQSSSGVLILMPSLWNSSLGSITGDVTVDTDCDGVPDWFAATSGHTEVPLVVGPAGTRIWVDLGLGASVNPMTGLIVSSGATRTWQMLFMPGTYGVQRHATGCIGGLSVTRSLPDFNLELRIRDPNQMTQAPTIAATWLLVGLAPAAIPLPVPPFCTQNVQVMALVSPGSSSNPWAGIWTLPNVSLPPGLTLYAQVVWLHYNGSAFASDTLRTF